MLPMISPLMSCWTNWIMQTPPTAEALDRARGRSATARALMCGQMYRIGAGRGELRPSAAARRAVRRVGPALSRAALSRS
ncbi:MAG: hypothetical protein AMXMBFR66_14720 [Pseudomonadota bacterium]